MKAVVIYYSRGGTTKKMAQIIHEELKQCGVDADIFSVDSISPKQLLAYDGIIMGSPTYYGLMAGPLKQLLDESVAFHGKLDGKVGGAFSSAANIAGGNETTVLAIIQAMLIHGMVVQGNPQGDHYGPVAIAKVDSRVEQNCRSFSRRFAALLEKTRR